MYQSLLDEIKLKKNGEDGGKGKLIIVRPQVIGVTRTQTRKVLDKEILIMHLSNKQVKTIWKTR